MNQELHPTLRVQLYTDTKCFGPGIAKLLQRVEERRSLRAAAQSMDMAYSKAWTMVRNCEAALSIKLLEYTTGGRHGGGAVLTPAARDLLMRYTTYCNCINEFARTKFNEQFSDLL